jgi:hypothetical protein
MDKIDKGASKNPGGPKAVPGAPGAKPSGQGSIDKSKVSAGTPVSTDKKPSGKK